MNVSLLPTRLCNRPPRSDLPPKKEEALDLRASPEQPVAPSAHEVTIDEAPSVAEEAAPSVVLEAEEAAPSVVLEAEEAAPIAATTDAAVEVAEEAAPDVVLEAEEAATDEGALLVESDAAPTADAMASNHTTRELKEMALRAGVSQAGKKVEICRRIISAQSSSPDAPAA